MILLLNALGERGGCCVRLVSAGLPRIELLEVVKLHGYIVVSE